MTKYSQTTAIAEFSPAGFDRLTREFMRRFPSRCAAQTATAGQKIYYLALLAALLFLLKYRWDWVVAGVAVYLAFWYFSAMVLRGGATFAGLGRDTAARVSEHEARAVPDAELPVYTILLPLYHESEVAAKLLKNLAKLDYPAEKLDVLLLLEPDDSVTRAALDGEILPAWCRILTAPEGVLRTKPRACNYGLEAARGELCVIYDAEDAPEPDQLRKSAAVFRRDRSGKLACVQARLNYYNPYRNWLTAFFTVEYTTHFDLLLGGMQKFRLPLPLGGTSNHFRTAMLRDIGGWDPFNVTEDCDLGLRIYESGYRTAVLDSTTFEEANSRPGNWMRQRSRWVKGFLQTHLAHWRTPLAPIRSLGWRGAFGAYLEIGGGALMMLTNVWFWALLVFYAALLVHGSAHGVSVFDQIVGPRTGPDLYEGIRLGVFRLRTWPLVYWGADEAYWASRFSIAFFAVGAALFLGNFIFIGAGVAAVIRRRWWRLLPFALLMPFYWLLISLAAWKGFIQLFTKPFYWEKTRHGLDPQKS